MSFTPDSDLELAFDAQLLPSQFKATLPLGIHLRPLASTDHSRSHIKVLSDLTVCPDPGVNAWTAQFNYLVSTKNTYYPIVLVDEASDQIVGVGTVFLERKFVRGLGLVGHIEDIAVSSSAQGKGFGKKIIEVLTVLSESLGAYKVSFCCLSLSLSHAHPICSVFTDYP